MGAFRQRTVLLADGDFPRHAVPLACLHAARRIVCCDGAADALLAAGLQPAAVVGDLDSLSPAARRQLADRLVHLPEQESNDLAKAFRHCLAQGWRDLVILGACGRREDHTLGNLAWLADFAREAPDITLLTDSGVFTPLLTSAALASFRGQAISIFSLDPQTAIRSTGLRYPLNGLRLTRWWQATLNEATGDRMTLAFSGGPLLVFAAHAAAAVPEESAAPLPVALTIAGSDSGGNAGIQADLRAFHALGVHGCTAITALTAQNPAGVRGVQLADPAFLTQQLDAIFEGYEVDAIKCGMLATRPLIAAVAAALAARPRRPLVVDPVMVASSGARLLDDAAVETLCRALFPLATLLTPNLPEAAALLGRPLTTISGARQAARELGERHGCAVLLKGGHDAAQPAQDCFWDGAVLWLLQTPVVAQPLSVHGTGCTLSAAIAASLAKGRDLRAAVVEGKACVYEAIRSARRLGAQAAVLGLPACLPIDAVDLCRADG